jgi:hypothetical protein
MAAEAIALLPRMRIGKLRHVAGKAFRPEEPDWFHGLIMRIMASSAPQPAIALTGAGTSCELLHVADDFEFLAVPTRWRYISVRGENIF